MALRVLSRAISNTGGFDEFGEFGED